MGRKPNQLGTATLTVSTTPQVERLLEQLVDTGLFGKNTAEAAERVITEALRGLLNDPTLRELRGKTSRRAAR
jgi:hypothetical protein